MEAEFFELAREAATALQLQAAAHRHGPRQVGGIPGKPSRAAQPGRERVQVQPQPPADRGRGGGTLRVGNLLLYYQEGDPSKAVAPDLMVALGVSKQVRSSYRLWEEPKRPDFVLELGSASTYRLDQGAKRALVAALGVGEYWQCDPTGSSLRPPLTRSGCRYYSTRF